jgi:hypothetical protein
LWPVLSNNRCRKQEEVCCMPCALDTYKSLWGCRSDISTVICTLGSSDGAHAVLQCCADLLHAVDITGSIGEIS